MYEYVTTHANVIGGGALVYCSLRYYYYYHFPHRISGGGGGGISSYVRNSAPAPTSFAASRDRRPRIEWDRAARCVHARMVRVRVSLVRRRLSRSSRAHGARRRWSVASSFRLPSSEHAHTDTRAAYERARRMIASVFVDRARRSHHRPRVVRRRPVSPRTL